MENKSIDSFINRYQLSKTLRFKLKPIGETESNFIKKGLLEDDKQRAQDYIEIKRIIDDYHKVFIDKVLSDPKIVDANEYAVLYYKSTKNDKEIKEMKDIEARLRKQVSSALTKNSLYGKLFKKELFTDILPEFIKSYENYEEKSRLLDSFNGFVTYFSGFFENRKNMYSEEEKSTAIAYRCINENLPKFLDNCKVFEKISDKLPKEKLEELNENISEICGVDLQDMFEIDYFGFVMSQKGIDLYNQAIGGYSNSDKTKTQGINEIINLYNQTNKDDRLPKLKPLYKQILSDKETLSFIPESFNDDNEVINAVNMGYNMIADCMKEQELNERISELDTYDLSGIYVKSECVSSISQQLTKDWSAITEQWNEDYDSIKINPSKPPKDMEKYLDERRKEFKKKSFSLFELQVLISRIDNSLSIVDYYKDSVFDLIGLIHENYEAAKQLLTEEYNCSKKLSQNDHAVEKIKVLLDSIKDLESVIKQFMVTDTETSKDERFYGDIQPVYDKLRDFDRLYDKVRNYVTKKPYTNDKIKLNFQNPQFLNGWDKNKEKDYHSVLLKNGEKYYLAIMDKSDSKAFERFPSENSNGWIKLNYKLLPGPNKMLPKVFFAKSNIDFFAPSNEIMRIRNEETFKKGDKFNKSDCGKLIDFYKQSLSKHEEWREYGFVFKDTKDYNDIGEFYNDVRKQGYKLTYENINEEYLMDKVKQGKVYLFQIYNKDFSEYSKGTPNMHTLYFKMLFDERNLKDVVYQLNGGAEMFYRFPSLKIEETTVHKAGEAIRNKNKLSGKESSTFDYDIIKNKRYTEPQFSLHVPITLNFKSQGKEQSNLDVRKALKNSSDNYVIGIDRGERHLLYVSVIDSNGKIVEQYSLNSIINEYNGKQYETNYHDMLDTKETERDKARKNWTTIENIKELKEGYISQAVHKICELVVKYDAVIAMEDLNFGFKKGRFKVEKQVYQKFEKMLIDKLNYLVINKNADPEQNGGLLKAYQLTEKFTSFKKMGKQNGYIFYIPAWLTSKIDPVTGFVDLLRPKYTSVDSTKDMITKFDFVRYNAAEDMFEIGIDYAKVERGITSYRSKWTVCTNGERILSFRNKDKNSEWDNETIRLTDSFKALFDKYSISYPDGEDIREKLTEQTSSDFFKRFVKLLSLTLQMRNSVTNSDIDYLISPVRDKNGNFYCSSDHISDTADLPTNADANGAYNIARKALWCIEQIKATDDDDLKNVKLAISNKQWLEYVQKE